MKYYNSGTRERYEKLIVESQPYKIQTKMEVKMEGRHILVENSNKKMQSLPKKGFLQRKGDKVGEGTLAGLRNVFCR